MSWADITNGSFETLGGILVWLNCHRLYQDKQVKGVSLWTAAFFATWAWWNLYYYPSLGQWFSFAGGILIGAANLAWIVMAIYYTVQNKKKELIYG